MRFVDAVCAAATPTPTKCRSCRAPIFYVTMAKTRASAPLDLEPSDEGLVLWPWGVDAGGSESTNYVVLGCVLRKDELAPFRGSGHLYVSHFVTCPNSAKHRKTKGESS